MFPSSRLLAVVAFRRIRPVLQHSYPASPQFRRNFSLTPHPQATEDQDSFIANFKHTAIFQKLADKPEALTALKSFAKLLQEQGVPFV